jgi:peroxiredoxin
VKKTFLHLALAWLLMFSAATPALCQLASGTSAPDFKLRNLQGKLVRLSDYAGRPVVLLIGTTWCPGCRVQMAELERSRGFLDDNRIVVLDVFIQESPGAVQKYLKNKKLPRNFEALIDDGQVHRSYRVYPVPRVLVLDGSRRIVEDTLGIDGTGLENLLRQHVGKPASAL